MLDEFHVNKVIFFKKWTGSLTKWYTQEKQNAT